MDSVWSIDRGRFAFVGPSGDVGLHHHPVVQLAVGLEGPVAVVAADDTRRVGRVAVMSSGARHALCQERATRVLSIYLGPEDSYGAMANAIPTLAGGQHGVWLSDDDVLADRIAERLASVGLLHATDYALEGLAETVGNTFTEPAHPHLQRAVAVMANTADAELDLTTVAKSVGLSPDYLGRLFKRHNGVSFSMTLRWMRLLRGIGHIAGGSTITDASHLSGFTDSAHANRACWELGGASPRTLIHALGIAPSVRGRRDRGELGCDQKCEVL